MLEQRTRIDKTPDAVDEEVVLMGWVDSRRDHGKLVFLDLRDRSGLVQCVVKPDTDDAYEIAQTLRDEWVVQLVGTVHERPEGMRNPDIVTGDVEVVVTKIVVLAQSDTPPIPLETDGRDIAEDLRLQYRYLDLRRERLQQNLALRDRWQNTVRQWLHNHDFLEVETPILTKSTPEGARDFLVSSRMKPGSFYALPQSPQQYKQLLMVAGIERYFQWARCFRDEDLRGDRALEFTQLDLEMSFVDQEDVLQLVESLIVHVSEALGKSVQETPFPRLTHHEALDQHGTDAPDLRNDADEDTLAYVWITDFPMFERHDDGSIGPAHHPFTKIHPDDVEKLDGSEDDLLSIRAQQYDISLNGHEVFGGSIRETDPDVLARVFEVLGHDTNEIQDRFGHLLEAFRYGVPPHGGIAASDRWLQVMLGEESIREVIPFPTSGSGTTAVMEAPTTVDPDQLRDLGITLVVDEEDREGDA